MKPTRRQFLVCTASTVPVMAIAALPRQQHQSDVHRDFCKHCGMTGLEIFERNSRYCYDA